MEQLIKDFVTRSLEEDVRDGDHTTLATIPASSTGVAFLEAKENGIIAGIEVVGELFRAYDLNLDYQPKVQDGDRVEIGDILFKVTGSYRSILTMERLVLNTMQRMSGIATITNVYSEKISHTKASVLDTRKTTPGFRWFEKLAVKIGGGSNHRFGLYDMILIKDNHIDAAGGIHQVLDSVEQYLKSNNLNLDVEIEVRSLEDVKQVLENAKCTRVMLDNFSVADTEAAVKLIGDKFEIESSGGIVLDTIRSYAEAGVDFISVGALTHSVKSLDMSLKIEMN